MKKLITFLLTSIMLFACMFGLSGCSFVFHTSGDFMYTIDHTPDGKKTYATIRQFSEQGKEKEVVVVPKEIDGYHVSQYGDNLRGTAPPPNVYLESEKLQRIYFCDSSVDIIEQFALRKCVNLQYIFITGIISDGEYACNEFRDYFDKFGEYLLATINHNSNEKYCNVYLYNFYYKNYYLNSKTYEINNETNRRFCTLPGNVTYYYNYDGAPNDGYYWLDNYDYGEKIAYPPENPTRDGFAFGGWYTERECENEWDFETSTLPAAATDDNGEVMYQETKLFARWVK